MRACVGNSSKLSSVTNGTDSIFIAVSVRESDYTGALVLGNVNINKEQTELQSEQPDLQLEDDPNTPNDERLESLIKSKDNIINAYSLLLTIAENNPVIVNKFIVAKVSELGQLIKLLTEADDVQINFNLDVDCSCVGSSHYSEVDKIYIIKGNQTLNFKYSYPNANKILDDHRVSVKYVIDA